MNVIFSLLIQPSDPYNNDYLNIKSIDHSLQNVLPYYYMFEESITENKRRYAEFCNAKFILFTRDQEFLNFESNHKNLCKHLTTYDVIQYYKIYLCEKLSKEYDNVLYLDYDVLIGNIKKNFFKEWSINKGIVIKQDKFDCTKFKYEKRMPSRYIKVFLAHLILSKMNIDHDLELPYYNTGIVGCNTNISTVTFFDLLKDCLIILDEIYINKREHYNIVRFSNEIIFTVAHIINNFDLQPISNKIWHKKANGVDDMNSVLLHCTNKSYIERYVKYLNA